MRPRLAFSSIYALMVRDFAQRGLTRGALEEHLEELALQNDVIEARYTDEVPEAVAKQQLALMDALGGPAPRKPGR